MITTLKTTLKVPDTLRYTPDIGPMLHGFIMSSIDPEYAEQEHISRLRSFSQYTAVASDTEWVWTVNALTDDAKVHIIDKLTAADYVYLKNKKAYLTVVSREITETDPDSFFINNYGAETDNSRYITLNFITPTTFKSRENEQYLRYPVMKTLINSLLNKYDSVSANTSVHDPATFDALVSSCEVVSYNLRSVMHRIEGVKIPAFRGSITIRVNGSQSLVNMMHMLTDMSEYTGIGIKTALGMGAVTKKRNMPSEKSAETERKEEIA